jgi:hypothetical protein
MREMIKVHFQGGTKIVRFAGICICAALISSPMVANAQMADQVELREINSRNAISTPAVANPFSLLDLSRVQWSHSYSVSYGSSRRGSGSYGMATTSMFYEFSPALSLAVGVGIGHNPGALFSSNTNSSSELFPSFSLDYHPSSKFRLNLTVARMPYSPRSLYPYGYNSVGITQGGLFGYPSFIDHR